MAEQDALLDQLRTICGPAAVLTAPGDIEPYAVDWKQSFVGSPFCVVRPGNTGEVAKVVAACRKHGTSIVPQGGNTGLAGGATPDASSSQVLLSLNRLTRIRSLDPIGMTVEVEAGTILQSVKEEAAKKERLLPVSLAAEGSATIGGIVSTNAGGVNVLRHGMTRALVLGLEVVLADGTIVNGLRHLRKDNAGYDWKQLFIGAEGTLGIVTAAVLRLVPAPRHSVTALLSVADVETAIALYAKAQSEIGDALSAFELISGESIALVERHAGLKSPIAAGEWFLLIEAASSLTGLEAAMQVLLAAAFEEELALDGVIAASHQQAQSLWALREHVTEAEAREGRGLKHDISVPLTVMPAYLADARAAVAAVSRTARLNVFGHLGDGNLHYNVLLGPEDHPAAVNRAVHDAVVRHRGSISAEHGLGQYRVGEWQRTKPAAEQALAHTIKQAIDPAGLFNPGKVLAAPNKGGAA
ncbi:FAD-binding oxidoreductase [Sinorhizobium meliloti]|uniref:FAD-binding oxidoreductase n=1 Tax=Rhizobium meliloti TaxID=382 RepID=UPI00031E412F|nr:FAD-binding oxidoreductase [Sinorhizobium meliloti]ASJ61361.1 FAD-binding oxidoreductase [Sinorhizobium meliloti]MCK3785603.1 FAD-binding oxidoreductase [Sinorhizobium meliloti]MCK3791729.1 FAD-binding oxidoreductase [Sinorhizobium meliloti]MCK3797140.1 FAD-binding oxidoreductase [Sinorhizobium meliloti]MCO6425138.1 FAD-binding oxidoreductase [Sinorhizobium meliloti]